MPVDSILISRLPWLCVLLLAVCSACNQPIEPAAAPVPVEHTRTTANVDLPLGLPEFSVPKDNPLTDEKIALGRELFFDKNLSIDRTLSCASCHDPEKHWGNSQTLGVGVESREGTRNVPTLINLGYYLQYFWDGRAQSLEAQALFPLLNENEMGMPSHEAILERLNENPKYAELFGKAFSNGITISNMTKAFACFERTILSGNAPYDRYMAGDKDALSESAIRGLDVFMNRGKCGNCHVPPKFTEPAFYNLGVGMDKETPDLGRYDVLKMNFAKGRFRTPSVRDIAKTGPYMHDGSLETLEEVVDLYDDGGVRNRHLSAEIRPRLRLTDQEKKDLVTFLIEGLTTSDDIKRSRIVLGSE